MDILLIVFKQFVFLLGEVVRFKRYFKIVCWFWRSLKVYIFGFMDGSDQVEPVSLLFLLSGSKLAYEGTGIVRY